MMNHQDFAEPYESGRALAYVAMSLFAINILVHLIAVASVFMQIDLLYKVMEETTQVTREQLLANDAREALVRVVVLVSFIATAIGFLIWVYRAYKNLRPLGANPDTTPGWAVGYFFVPILNLFRPFQVFQEMWRESDPETVTASGIRPMHAFIEDSSKSLLVIFWWGLWLLANIASWIALSWNRNAQILNDYIIASWINMASDLLTVIAAIACIIVIKKITDRQDEKNKRLAELATPPENLPAPQQA
jgi:hypothetical protein